MPVSLYLGNLELQATENHVTDRPRGFGRPSAVNPARPREAQAGRS